MAEVAREAAKQVVSRAVVAKEAEDSGAESMVAVARVAVEAEKAGLEAAATVEVARAVEGWGAASGLVEMADGGVGRMVAVELAVEVRVAVGMATEEVARVVAVTGLVEVVTAQGAAGKALEAVAMATVVATKAAPAAAEVAMDRM